MKKLVFLVLVLFIAAPYLVSYTPAKVLFTKLLEHKFQNSVQIDTLRLSWFGPQQAQNIRFQNKDFDGVVETFTSPLPLWKLPDLKESFSIENGTVQVHAPGYPAAQINHLHAVVNGPKVEATATTTEADKTGSLKVRAEQQNADYDITAMATNVPSLLVDRLVNAHGKLAALVGPSMNGTLSVKTNNRSGTIALDIDGTNTDASGTFDYTPDTITLKEPLLVTCHLTPESSTLLLGTKVQSQTPILLRVFPEGFSMSRPFSIDKLQIGHATLDLGKFQVENTAPLSALFNMLKSQRSGQWVSAWFNEVDATMQNGTLSLGRVDALFAGNVHLCAWGDILLSQDKLAMNLGIPADTLKSAFGIQNLNDNYVLKVPVQGTLQNPEFVTGPASAKIATMAAAQAVPKPGPVGTFFGIINAATNDSSDVPPAKRPFPWEK